MIWFGWVYGISTIIGYLMSYPVFNNSIKYQSFIYTVKSSNSSTSNNSI